MSKERYTRHVAGYEILKALNARGAIDYSKVHPHVKLTIDVYSRKSKQQGTRILELESYATSFEIALLEKTPSNTADRLVSPETLKLIRDTVWGDNLITNELIEIYPLSENEGWSYRRIPRGDSLLVKYQARRRMPMRGHSAPPTDGT